MIQGHEMNGIAKNLKTISDSLVKLYKTLTEANAIAKAHKTILELEQALNQCGVFEYERKIKFRNAIHDVKTTIQDYSKRLKESENK